MLLKELFESKLPKVEEDVFLRRVPMNEGIEHPEDLVIDHGSAGAMRVYKELLGLEHDSDTVSIKWDGFPAVIFGRDPDGKLVLVDKHMFDKIAQRKMEFTTIKDYDEGRKSDRSDLWKKETVLRAALERIVPDVKDQYWWGDLMWVGKPVNGSDSTVKSQRKGKLIKEGNKLYFKPNTVQYSVPMTEPLGKQMAASVAGIAVHTFIPGLGKSDQPLTGLKGLPENKGIVFLTGEIKEDKPRVTVEERYKKEANSAIRKYGAAADHFRDQLIAMKAKTVLTHMRTFITRMLEEEDIKTDIVPRFLDYLGEKLSDAAAAKLLGTNENGWLYQKTGGAPGLLAMWKLWAAIVDLKIHIKTQIDAHLNGSLVRAEIEGKDSHEGYVFGGGEGKLKLIDRLGFSAANFAQHNASDSEIEAANSMPMAAFCFGRMNPPTVGHELVMRTTVKVGGSDAFIFLSSSNDPKDNPLDPAAKAAFISKIYPHFASHIVKDYVSNPIQAANWMYARGYRNITFVAGSDRLGKKKGSIERILRSWNSGPVRANDFQFGPEGREYVSLHFVSSGARDADAEGIKGYSGSKARAAAAADNETKFREYTGVKSDIRVGGHTLYQAVRHGMGLHGSSNPIVPEPEKKAAKNVKERALLELRDLDTSRYGGWINAADGRVYYVNGTHKDTANSLGIEMRGYEDYGPAYDRHLVRFVQNFPQSFEISGNLTDLRKTFRLWWSTAIKAENLWADINDSSKYLTFDLIDPKGRAEARQLFGPAEMNETEVWDKPSTKSKHKKLTDKQKAAAKARARRAGRSYPNLIDNMWASKR